MDEIMVKPQQLISYAQEMESLKKRMDAAVSASESTVGQMSQVWEDANHEQFDADFRSLIAYFREFSKNLTDAADKARRHAELMARAGK